MIDLDVTADLLPVSQWVYDLYEVKYWTANPEEGGRPVATKHIAASCTNHMEADMDRNCPHGAYWMTWIVIKSNVGHPRCIGTMGMTNIYEDGIAHGRRLFEQM